tara:strand:- start:214 stop:900 length:687 start_codon:yes stop_codon:yes gene_type:complete
MSKRKKHISWKDPKFPYDDSVLWATKNFQKFEDFNGMIVEHSNGKTELKSNQFWTTDFLYFVRGESQESNILRKAIKDRMPVVMDRMAKILEENIKEVEQVYTQKEHSNLIYMQYDLIPNHINYLFNKKGESHCMPKIQSYIAIKDVAYLQEFEAGHFLDFRIEINGQYENDAIFFTEDVQKQIVTPDYDGREFIIKSIDELQETNEYATTNIFQDDFNMESPDYDGR